LPAVLPASAQTADTDRTTTTNPDGRVYNTRDDRDFDWGWLGLLGLLGLAGLAKKREEPVRYRDPNEVGTTGTRY
jgi:MYXO-CTERM domain-containing protein